ncbi:hypothetical protein CsSME_00005515 [Camellia sinensis var. sinensis]
MAMMIQQNLPFLLQPISPSTSSSPRLFPSKPLSLPSHPITTVRSPKSKNQIRSTRAASTSGFGDNITDVLGEVTIFTATGEPVMFRDLWDQKEGMAVVALLRHFGCVCCWELASALKESKPRFDSAGLPFPSDCLYADPDRKAYDVLGLYYGIGRTFFNPASAKVFSRFENIQKALKNYTIEATPDDRSSVLQQGGMLVFKGKQLLYARKDEGTGDHAPLDDIFNICRKASVA